MRYTQKFKLNDSSKKIKFKIRRNMKIDEEKWRRTMTILIRRTITKFLNENFSEGKKPSFQQSSTLEPV